MTLEQAVGLGALVSVLVGIVKKFHLIPDGYAGVVAVVGNSVIFAFLEISKALCAVPDAYCPDVAQWDSVAGALAALAALVIPYLAQNAASLAAHVVARKLIPKGVKLLPGR